MNGKNYSEGSIWRRWDLHIHTPETKKNDQFNGATPFEKWANYVSAINNYPSDISTIGITDYVCTDNYFKFKQLVADGTITKTFDLILPNVELRISPVTGNSTPINIHCIFNPEFETKILTRFFQNLYFEYNNRKYKATKAELIELGRDYSNDQTLTEPVALKTGIMQFVVPFKILRDLFEADPDLKANTVVIVANSSKDGASGLASHFELFEGEKFGALEATRQNIYQFSDAIFSSNEGDCYYFLGTKKNKDGNIIDDEIEVKRKCGSLKPCFHGCDAHSNEKVFSPDLDLYCWVKADPTFEGLKQVIYEPYERVKIRTTNPSTDFDKPLFTSIEIIDDLKVLNDENSELTFSKSQIPLNGNLVSIIGGRGQGKSMLINYKGHGLGKEIAPKLQDKINLNDSYVVNWQQSSEATIKSYSLGVQTDLPFTFIYQSKVKEIADDNEALKREIIEMLNGAGFQKPSIKIDEFQVKEVFQKYWNIKEWLERKDDKGKLINDDENLNKKIESVQANISLATEGSNKDLLEKYVLNISAVGTKTNDLTKLRELRKSIVDYRETINSQILEFPSITPIDTTQQQKDIIKLYKQTLSEINLLENDNKKIKEENFKDYKGDLSQLLSNLTNFQKEITEVEEQVKNVLDNKKELLVTKEKLNEIIKEQRLLLGEEAIAISRTWKEKIFDNPERGESENKLIKKILADKDIKIEGLIFFNINQFYVAAEKFIDGRSLKPKTKERIFELLEIGITTTSNDVLNYTIEKLEGIRNDNPGCFYDGIDNDIFKIFIDPTTKNKYTYVIPYITVEGKNLNELSAGQKGTVYLCLKLATQLFSGPIVFDQPEDDLDNDFITNQLIELFKEIKKYRQVIIVSHNANLVVNADSEQVIIAKNNSEKLSYESGALENETINKEICRILEGGERAFEKRRDKYRYVK